MVCRRYSAKNLDANSPPLPLDRVRSTKIFEIIGIDFAGPVYLKSQEKAWICLFTCSVYRAVHLELTTSLSTKNFLQTLRRFIARRGRPKTIYTDNGTNFVGTRNLLNKVNWSEVEQFGSIREIEWHFNPPSAAWWGGWWERLVGLLKQMLRRILGRACLNYEEFVTLLCECEAVMNNRPLTYVSNNPQDPIPLTPSMFLHELNEQGTPDLDIVEGQSLEPRLKYLMKLRIDLRRRFRSEYLGFLKHLQSKGNFQPLTLNEIVLVGDDNSKRINWPLGRVVQLMPGGDGIVRVAKVQTERGQLIRPVQRLYPLEYHSSIPLPRIPLIVDLSRTNENAAEDEEKII